jgi:hypothetical protein
MFTPRPPSTCGIVLGVMTPYLMMNTMPCFIALHSLLLMLLCVHALVASDTMQELFNSHDAIPQLANFLLSSGIYVNRCHWTCKVYQRTIFLFVVSIDSFRDSTGMVCVCVCVCVCVSLQISSSTLTFNIQH